MPHPSVKMKNIISNFQNVSATQVIYYIDFQIQEGWKYKTTAVLFT